MVIAGELCPGITLYNIVICRPTSRKRGGKHFSRDSWKPDHSCETTGVTMDTSDQRTFPGIPIRYISGSSDKNITRQRTCV
jgi:hypothetical protein